MVKKLRQTNMWVKQIMRSREPASVKSLFGSSKTQLDYPSSQKPALETTQVGPKARLFHAANNNKHTMDSQWWGQGQRTDKHKWVFQVSPLCVQFCGRLCLQSSTYRLGCASSHDPRWANLQPQQTSCNGRSEKHLPIRRPTAKRKTSIPQQSIKQNVNMPGGTGVYHAPGGGRRRDEIGWGWCKVKVF
jgi:hypothetical protein